MTTISTPKGSGGKLSPATLAIAFVAGVLAVPVFHQILFLVFYLTGVIPVAPFSMMPTVPFGVPEVISSSFWGGVWGIVFVLTLPRFFRGGPLCRSRTHAPAPRAPTGRTALCDNRGARQ